mmetsp:Transcript_57820/g.161387  ORF Transcript_57820/g.161387 Transcript_57820/m.161387 type:complete len:295 (-) Transcript_57820:127-1011(-)
MQRGFVLLRIGAVRRFGGASRHNIRRVDYPWKGQLLKTSWEFMKQEMINHFETQPSRDSTIHIRARKWPRYTMKEQLIEKGQLPALISKHGPERRVMFNKSEIERIAFDEPQGHLSYLFKGRLFRIHVDDWIEECVVADVATHPVEKELQFIRFDRHLPGHMTTVPIPVTLSGLWGCPGYQKGGHVELAMPTVMCECIGETLPPPFLIDVSGLKLDDPYGKLTLRDLHSILPTDGTARFARDYTLDEEVVMCYDPKAFPEVPLPSDWQDPNFDHRGGRYHLTYTGFWPKQITRQ